MIQLFKAAHRVLRREGARSLATKAGTWIPISVILPFVLLDREALVERASENGTYWSVAGAHEHFFSSTGCSGFEFEFEAPIGQVSTPEQFVCTLDGCHIVGSEPVFLTHDFRVILEQAKNDRRVLKNRLGKLLTGGGLSSVRRELRQTEQDHEYGVVFPLIRYSNQPSYYHWWMEELASLRRLSFYERHTGEQATILVEPDPPGWVEESIRLLGFDDHDIVEWSDSYATCERLVLPTYNHHVPDDFHPVVDDYRWLRRTALSNVSSADTRSFSERVYISREAATERGVANRDAVMEVLSPLGFESVQLETLGVDDQLALFETVDVAVGPHGAGFTNMLFSETGTFVEFVPRNRPFAFFRNLSQCLNLEYHCIPCDGRDGDVVVPVDELQRWLETSL